MKDRIRLIMESQKMNAGTFAKFVGISSSSLSNVFNGRTNPTLSMVMSIHEQFPEISYPWLLEGKGDMYANGLPQPTSPEQVATPAKEARMPKEEKADIKAKPATNKARPTELGLAFDFQDEKKADKANSLITEIRVFFDDLHYESFVPINKK
ncbi:MAG: helix-turn-helix transcriptional regulator [Prevotella sp.]|nr:helix-turn-helix transcriptional regulator [Prevotella sp.]